MKGPKAPSEIDADVGEKIRARRLARGWSQTQLANALGITFQQVQKYEKGANRVSSGRLARIAEALEIPVALFFDSRATQPPERRDANATLAPLLEAPGVVGLLRAFSAIDGRKIRAAFVGLAESAASHQPRRRPRPRGFT